MAAQSPPGLRCCTPAADNAHRPAIGPREEPAISCGAAVPPGDQELRQDKGLSAISALLLPWPERDSQRLLPTAPPPHCLHSSIMTPLLAVFLVALVGLPVAQALECHVCAYNGDNCFNPMRCPAMATYCMTTRTYFTPYRMKVRKSCVPKCFETVYDGYSKHASATSCCQYYLCNGAGFAAPVTLVLVPILLTTLWGFL